MFTIRHALLVTSVALGTAVAGAGTAIADDVLAYGTNVDGMCVFEPAVLVPAGVTVTANSACHLLAVPGVPPDRVIGPGGTFVPKRARTDVATGGGLVDVPPLSTEDLGSVTKAAEDAQEERTYRIEVRRTYWNERDQLMYDDMVAFTYRQAEGGGPITGVTPNEAYCATGAGTYPHVPVTDPEQCYWRAGYLGGQQFSFVAHGEYRDYVAGVQYDHRRVETSFVARYDGSFSLSCGRVAQLPPQWTSAGCPTSPTVVA